MFASSLPSGLSSGLMFSLDLESQPLIHTHMRVCACTHCLPSLPHVPLQQLSLYIIIITHTYFMYLFRVCLPLGCQLVTARCCLVPSVSPVLTAVPSTCRLIKEWLMNSRCDSGRGGDSPGLPRNPRPLPAHTARGSDTREGSEEWDRKGKLALQELPGRGSRPGPWAGGVFRATQASCGIAGGAGPRMSPVRILPSHRHSLESLMQHAHQSSPSVQASEMALPPTHTALGRRNLGGLCTATRELPTADSDHLTTQLQTFHGSPLSWGQSLGSRVAPQTHFPSLPTPSCIPATRNRFHFLSPHASLLLGHPTPCDASPSTLSGRLLLILLPWV